MCARGGRREGAGRPKLPEGQEKKHVNIRIDGYLLDEARRVGDGNVSLGVGVIIEYWILNQYGVR